MPHRTTPLPPCRVKKPVPPSRFLMTVPLNVNVLRLFVASPNDVQRERKELAKVVDRLNRIFERIKNTRIQLVRWETDTYPGVGADAQDVINTQIRDDYEIFVGILWRRLGTPTGRADSGTAEEYERARSRHDANPGSVAIMWYFKESPPPKGMPQRKRQGQKVRRFQERLSNTGVYYATFRSTIHFRDLVDQHLANYLCDQIDRRESIADQISKELPREIERLTTQVQTEASNFEAAAIQLSRAFLRFGGTWDETMTRIGVILGKELDDMDLTVINGVLERLRLEFEEFADQIESSCPKLGQSFNQFAWGSIRLFSITSKLGLPNATFMFTFVQSQTQRFHAVAQEGIGIHSHLHSMFAESRYASPALNTARLRAMDAIDQLANEYRSIEGANRVMLDLIKSILGGHDRD